MKISFSTLGCPGWTWEEMLVTAKDLGFDGIEVRGIGNELHVPKANPFSNLNINNTQDKLHRLGLAIPCLTSSCGLFQIEDREKQLEEGKEYIDLASKLGTKYVRVLGDANPQPGSGVDVEAVREGLCELALYASGRNVEILVETNGVFANSERIAGLITSVDSKNIGVLWDVHHPFRFYGESIDFTYGNLKDYIKFVHVKDSVAEGGKVSYKMTGHGDVPVRAAIKALLDGGYDGFVSLEWVKRWCLELEEPGVVFSHFVNYIRSIL